MCIDLKTKHTKFDYAKVLINDDSLDVFVLTETWLTGKIQDSDIVYNLFRMDIKSKAVGVVILVRDNSVA